jgi:transposase
MQGHITMSQIELNRLQILQRVVERRMTQAAAAQSLGLSYRQVKRLMARFRRQGAVGLTSRKRGQNGKRWLPAVYTEHILDLVREHYADFGPTLAREKLLERHGLLIGRETLRGLKRDAGLWRTRAARSMAIQQPRARRQYFGELIQIDGSEHHWFEDRGPYCTVLTYVDDATSRLQLLRFVEGESTFDYMQATNGRTERFRTVESRKCGWKASPRSQRLMRG